MLKGLSLMAYVHDEVERGGPASACQQVRA